MRHAARCLIWGGTCLLVLTTGCSKPTDTDQQAHMEMLQSLGAGADVNEAGELTFINLSHRPVSDAQLVCVQGHDQLKKLWLYDTPITDEGLKQLRDVETLEILVLGKTKVSDAGILHLVRLKNLKQLYLEETDVSSDGAAKLRSILSDTLIFL